MRWLLCLYPAWWRRRYGEEFLALLEGRRANPRLLLDVFRGALDARVHLRPERQARPTRACSFCGKDQRAVRRLIAGPNVYICDECIALCNRILAQDPPPTPAVAARQGQARWCPRPPWRRILVHRRRLVHQPG